MKINFKKLIIITIITFLVGSFFSFFVMDNMQTFKELNKPFELPGIIFPIVWSILYLLMSISYYISTEKSKTLDEKNSIRKIYIVQLIVNSLWTLIFFGLNLYFIGFLWILLLIVLVIIMIYRMFNVSKLSAYLQIPYLLWLVFAGFLNFSIFLLN